jgi:pimeloyl-ACP methyl ester carboxylesterase
MERSMAGNPQSHLFSVNGMTLHTRTWVPSGAPVGPVVILVHGLIVSSRYLQPTARLLANDYRVYTPDMPGFGRSPRPGQMLNLAEQADLLAAWIETLGIEQAVWLGNSLGCQVVATVALRHPRQVERAILVAPTVDPGRHTMHEQLVRLALTLALERPTLWLVALRDLGDAGLRQSFRAAHYALMDHIEQKLPLIQVPTLVVHGTHDLLVSRRWAETAARLLPVGRLVVIPGGTHAMNFSRPRALAQVVRAFLQEQRPERTAKQRTRNKHIAQ